MDKKPKYYTFMVIPHDAREKSFSIKIPALWIYAAVGAALFSVLIVGSSIVYSSLLSRRLVHYHNTIARNREQKEVIETFALRAARVSEAISELEQEDNRLRKLLGLKSWKTKIKLSSDLDRNDSLASVDQVKREFKKVDLKLAERKRSLEELKSWVNTVRERLATTPSRWPLYGRIVSRFGYRVYPWRGFHTGIDISGCYGAPIRATAAGRVSFVGWRRGYGKTVIITHGHGFSTLYAHLSKYAVNVGQSVRKGQIICYVGNTGYSTGPHLHYEVRKWGRPVNPVAYLNLNILTASRMWRQ